MNIPWLAPIGLILLAGAGVAAGAPYSLVALVGLFLMFAGTRFTSPL